MKLEKTKNAGKNMTFELFQNVYGIVVPFIQRTLMIIYLGIEYAGLGGLFTSILNVLSLAELGVGAAMIYSMYKPIAEDDETKVLQLLNLYKKYYRIIGMVICAIGLAITPFLKFIIKSGTCPKDLNIYILFLMTLASTVMTYWLYAYKSSVLQAHQKDYVATKTKLEATIIFDIFQIVFIVVFKNYYLYLACAVVRVIANNIIVAYRANKIFPQYKKPVGGLDKEEEKKLRRDIKDIFFNKIGLVMSDSFDAIVISTFLGLTILGQYQNYLYIWTSVITIAGIIFNATRAGIGNNLVSEDRKKVYSDFKTFTFIVTWIIVVVIVGFSNLFQPFIEIWVGKKNVLGYGVVICLCVFAMLRLFNYLLTTYKSAAGIWHADRFRPITSGIVNLAFNLITVHFWGLYGVILSTVVSLIIVDIPWLIYNVFHNIFKDVSASDYIKHCLKMLLYIVVTVFVSYLVVSFIKVNGVFGVILKLFSAMIVCNVCMVLLTFKTNEFSHSIQIIRKMISKS